MVIAFPPSNAIPPLANGDRLTRPEFERRAQALGTSTKAELVEGVVYMAAALRFQSHGQPHANIMTWLGNYRVVTPGVLLGDAPTVRLDEGNQPQPDGVMVIEARCGGRSWIGVDDYLEGAPELVVEIAASSAAIDLGDKKRAYCRNGIQEYIVWQIFDRRLDWFALQDGDYIDLPVATDGTIRSRVFPGLWLAVADLLTDNMPQVLATLQRGLASGEYQSFRQQLGADAH